MALQFGVRFGDGACEYVRVRRFPFRIGRSPKSDLCLRNSARISRQHARVTSSDGAYQLVALGKNPTYVNGQLIEPDQPREIRVGDLIELPDYHLEVGDTAQRISNTATTHLEAISHSSIIIRRVASSIGIQAWSAAGINCWLQAGRDRQIWIRSGKMELCVRAATEEETLIRQFTLFGELQDRAGFHQLGIEVVALGVSLSDPT